MQNQKGAPSHLKHPIPRATQGNYLARLWHVIWESIKYYSVGLWKYVDEDHCFLLAAGIAFNVLYCLIPLTLVAFYIFSIALSNEEQASRTVLDYISQSLPLPYYREALVRWLSSKLLSLKESGPLAGIIGGISLFWLASILFSTLRTSLNAIFGFKAKTNYFQQKLLDFVLMIVVIVLLLTTTLLSPIIGLLHEFGSNWLPDWLAGIYNGAIPFFIGVAISTVLYMILFRMLPHERLSRRVVFVCACTTVVLTEIMKYAFSFYMQRMSSIGALYGGFAFLVGISLWIYYVAAVFTIGAEVGWLYRERHEMLRSWKLNQKHPGPAAPTEQAVEAYHQVKPANPTQPVGKSKPPADDQGKPSA